MDIFRFTNPENPIKMQYGEIILGIKSKLWVERYLEAGEFKFTGPVSAGLKDKLPIGSYISHINTPEIMIVENHEINEEEGQEPEITITGRSFETITDQRAVGFNKDGFPRIEPAATYEMGADHIWNQVVTLVNNHIVGSYLHDDKYEIPYVSTISSVLGTGVSISRSLDPGSLYDHILELLKLENLGIKVIRPGVQSPFGVNSDHTCLMIHKGVDRQTSVIFSHDNGDIVSADYLWSSIPNKNVALVRSNWAEVLVDINPEGTLGIDRRMMFVDASDIDQDLEAAPTGTDATYLEYLLTVRGYQAIANANSVVLTKAEVSPNIRSAIYRRDYDVGDIVTVSGDYNEVSTMRVIEYVETEDETGEVGYPTLGIDQGAVEAASS